MRVQIYWPLISGYMAACWRELATQVEHLEIIAWRPDAATDNVGFSTDTVSGLHIHLLDQQERDNGALLGDIFRAGRPDVILVPGWFCKPYRNIAVQAATQGVPVVMCMDTTLRFSARQLAGRFYHARWFKRVSAVLVAGERSARLAHWLGFKPHQVHSGAYGFDYRRFSSAAQTRQLTVQEWPRVFAFAGRYVERKGIDTLVAAYRQYRAAAHDPWSLVCYGQGPLASLLAGQEGITDAGFRQPDELAALLSQAGAFVLPSRFEAWGVALAEAGAAGLPLIASSEVGAVPELLRDRYNGRIFHGDDPQALAENMQWIHAHEADCAEYGRRSQYLAEPFRAELWAERVSQLLHGLTAKGGNNG